GVRPGFGCGDTNHVHSGPPGHGPDFNPCARGREERGTATATPPTGTPTATGAAATGTPTTMGTAVAATATSSPTLTATGTQSTATATATTVPPTSTATTTSGATPAVRASASDGAAGGLPTISGSDVLGTLFRAILGFFTHH